MKGRHVAVAGALVVASLLIAVRIGMVNACAVEADYPIEHRQVGEWIDLDGVFFGTAAEDYSGYSIKVDSVSVTTPRDYLQRNSAKDIDFQDDLDAESVVEVGFTIRNEDSEEGGLAFYDYLLIPTSRNKYYQCDVELWDAGQPQLGGTMAFSVSPGSEYSLSAPFTLKGQPRYFDSYEKMRRVEVMDKTFELVLSNAPKRIVVDIDLL